MGNKARIACLLTIMTMLFVATGRLLGGPSGMLGAFGLAIVMNFATYWFSDRMALAMSRATEVSPDEASELHRIVDRLALQGRIPKPRVYVIDCPTPNAFATGRDPKHAAVAVTAGIVSLLNREELSGVLAHEMAHIRNRDTLIGALVATMAGAITMIAYLAQWATLFGGMGHNDGESDGEIFGAAIGGLLMMLLAPVAATLIQLSISRAREYAADAAGARILGDPLPLASALEKLETANQAKPLAVNPAMAHQFTVRPLSGGGLRALFSTHPPVSARVSRLRQLALKPTPYQGV